jgi:SLT domain-containing protein
MVEAMAIETDAVIANAVVKFGLGQFWQAPGIAAAIGQSGLIHAGAGAIRAIPMAEGGIVMPRPGGTLAQIGEAGHPEAVIPLDRMRGGMGNITINVAGSILTERDLERKIVSAVAMAGRGY